VPQLGILNEIEEWLHLVNRDVAEDTRDDLVSAYLHSGTTYT
jgi:hypothetical protein